MSDKSKSKEHQANLLIALGTIKLFSEQSTFLIGELSKEKAHWFNISVKAADNFLKEVEKDLDDHNKETLEVMVVELNNGMIGFKNDLLKHIH